MGDSCASVDGRSTTILMTIRTPFGLRHALTAYLMHVIVAFIISIDNIIHVQLVLAECENWRSRQRFHERNELLSSVLCGM